MKIESELNEFLQAVDGIYGLYLDTTTGFFHWHMELLGIQEKASAYLSHKGIPLEKLDKSSFEYIDSNKEKDDESLSHKCTYEELEERIRTGGSNRQLMANLCLVLIYQYWEYYREKLKKKTGKIVESDLMGDIRHLRISIIHNKGVGNENLSKCKVIKWFKEGGAIRMDENQVKELIKMIKKEIASVNKEYFT